MSLWLAENPIDSQHVVKNFIEQHQRHIQFFFIEYLVKMDKFLLKLLSGAAARSRTSTFWHVLTYTKAHSVRWAHTCNACGYSTIIAWSLLWWLADGLTQPSNQKRNVYLPSLMTEVPDHVYVLFCFLTASMSVSAILVTRCAFNTIL
jgi:hypothetical protein